MADAYLIDTHVFLWAAEDPSKLAAEAREVFGNARNSLLLSAACGWEIGIKHALGKLLLPTDVRSYMASRVRKMRLSPLPIEQDHAIASTQLPQHHRDPFDRVLIAQARALSLPILSSDRVFLQYDVDVVKA